MYSITSTKQPILTSPRLLVQRFRRSNRLIIPFLFFAFWLPVVAFILRPPQTAQVPLGMSAVTNVEYTCNGETLRARWNIWSLLTYHVYNSLKRYSTPGLALIRRQKYSLRQALHNYGVLPTHFLVLRYTSTPTRVSTIPFYMAYFPRTSECLHKHSCNLWIWVVYLH